MRRNVCAPGKYGKVARQARKAVSVFMAVILAVGLMPLPAFADSVSHGEFSLAAGSMDAASLIDNTGSTYDLGRVDVANARYGQQEVETWRVTYDLNGGSGTFPDQTKQYGEALILSSTWPTKSTSASVVTTLDYSDGITPNETLSSTATTTYQFECWEDAEGTKYSVGGIYIKEQDATLTAQWDDGTKSGTSITLPTPIREGYEFKGWRAGDDVFAGGWSIAPTSNMTLVASWEPLVYTISYIANGGTGAPAEQTKGYNKSIQLQTTVPTWTVAGNVQTTLKFNDEITSDSIRNSAITTTYSFEKWCTVANPTAENPGESYLAGATYSVNESVTLFARWGNATVTGSAISLPTPTRSGFTFKGWRDESGQIHEGGSSYEPTISGVLVAQWDSPAVVDNVPREVRASRKNPTYKGEELTRDEILVVTLHNEDGDEVPFGDGCSWKVKSCVPDTTTGAYTGANGLPMGAGDYSLEIEATIQGSDGTFSTLETLESLNVKRAALTITPDNLSKIEGDDDPELTFKADGLKGNDGVSPITLTRASGEAAGEYAIKVTKVGVVDSSDRDTTDNYQITKLEGLLTIEKKPEPPAPTPDELINKDIEEALNSMSDSDAAGSEFGLLQLKYKKATKNSIRYSWKKHPEATTYAVFGNLCGAGKKYQLLTKTAGTKFTYSKLKKGKSYKLVVRAYDAKGECVSIAKTVHVYTKGGKNGNVKKLTLNKKKAKVKAGKKLSLKSTVKWYPKKQKKPHRKVQFESSNAAVATVNKKGKVTVKKGAPKGSKATIYAYACDGTMATCKITVK